MAKGSLQHCRGHALGSGAELFFDTPLEIVRGEGVCLYDSDIREPDAASTSSLCDRLKDKGFLVSFSGKLDNVLKIRPPLVFSHANADDFLVAFDECLAEMGE
jgi:4-aminobutyrate aminotransferase-like enzyme